MSIGVAIPCYEPHHKYLPALLESIANQTHKPNRVVISCSSWAYDGRVDTFYKGIPLTILYWSRLVVQAENRNLAGAELETDYISFFDADDLMHPRRIEYILKAFERSKCDVIVHDYQYVLRGSGETFIEYDTLDLTDHIIVKNPNQPGCMLETGEEYQPFHHAHLTVHKSVFSRFQYPIDMCYYRREDSVYLSMLLYNQFRIRHIGNKLSQYMY